MKMVHTTPMQHRNIAIMPGIQFVTKRQVSVVGIKNYVLLYGNNGSKQDSRPSEVELKEAKREAKRFKQLARRKGKQIG